MSRSHQELVGALLALVLAGCEATQYYGGTSEKNLQVRSSLSGVRGVMGVHRLDKCTLQYEGIVELDRPVVEVGLPPGRPSILVFEFFSSGLAMGNTSIKKEAMVEPRPGYRYEASAVYNDSLYEVELREIDPGTGSSRVLDTSRRC